MLALQNTRNDTFRLILLDSFAFLLFLSIFIYLKKLQTKQQCGFAIIEKNVLLEKVKCNYCRYEVIFQITFLCYNITVLTILRKQKL